MDLIKQKTLFSIFVTMLILSGLGDAKAISNLSTTKYGDRLWFPSSKSIDTLHHLKGKWAGQEAELSCWKAALANLTRIDWDTLHRKEEKDIDPLNKQDTAIALMTFNTLINKKIIFTHHNYVKGNNILTFNAINQYLRYTYPRPLIHSFSYKEGEESDGTGHFVNIVGCDTTQTQSINHQWLEIFDPMPIGIGTKYLKNYESFSIIDDNFDNSLDATFFNFVRIKTVSNFPQPIENDRRKNRIVQNCIECFKEKLIKDSLKVILKDRVFKDYVGENITFKRNYKIPIYDLINNFETAKNSEDFSEGIETIEVKSTSSMIINYENNQLKGGTTIRQIKGKYLIDRVEDLSKYKDILCVSECPNPNLIITKNGNRFLKFKSKSEKDSIYIDMDNLFKNGTNKRYSKQEFQEQIKPQYLNISRAAREVIGSFNILMTKVDTTCCYTSPNTPCTKDDIKKVDLAKQHLHHFEIDAKYLYPKSNMDGKTSMLALAKKDPENGDYNFHIQSYKDLIKDTVSSCIKCGCLPKQVKYPYTNPDGNFNVVFVPIQEYKVLSNYDFDTILSAKTIKTNLIKQIGKPYLESLGGFISTKKSDNFNNKTASEGIIVEILKMDNSIVRCYVICNDPTRLQWKE